MPENEINPDPVFDKLARFTPDSTGLDRDAILFAAGRAAAQSRRWPVIAGFLAVTQAITLGLMFIPRSPQEMHAAKERPQISAPAVEPPPDYQSDGIIQVRSDPDRLPAESPVANPAPTGPTWTVLTSRNFSFD